MKPTAIRFAPDKLPRILRQLRENAGLSQRDVAQALGISVMTISRYETGKRSVHLSILVELVELYGYRVEFRMESKAPQDGAEG